jgi:AraC-like DNA-binding protein
MSTNHALVRSAALHGYETLARSLGVNVSAELRRVHLSLAQINDPDGLLPYAAMIALLEHTARVASCPDFGLQLSLVQDLGVLGPVAVVVRHASTLGEALQLASRYLFVQSPAARFSVVPVDGKSAWVDLAYGIDLPELPLCAQAIELALGVMRQGMRSVSGGRVQPTLACLPHARVGPPRSYAKVFDCECRFQMPLAALRIPASALQQPLPEHNPMLKQLAQRYLDQNFSVGAPSIANQVRAMLRRFLGTGNTAQTDIAAMLALHPRTMQRRLKEEGVSFDGILDSVRKEQLRHLLSQSNPPPLSQVAAMLGYSEQAVLTRSCRRWFGVSPSALRHNADAV